MKNRNIILLGITAITAISLLVLIAGKTKKQPRNKASSKPFSS